MGVCLRLVFCPCPLRVRRSRRPRRNAKSPHCRFEWRCGSVLKQLETRLKEIETFWAHLAPLSRCYVRGPKGDSRRWDREDDGCESIRPVLRPPVLCRKPSGLREELERVRVSADVTGFVSHGSPLRRNSGSYRPRRLHFLSVHPVGIGLVKRIPNVLLMPATLREGVDYLTLGHLGIARKRASATRAVSGNGHDRIKFADSLNFDARHSHSLSAHNQYLARATA